MVDPDRPPSTWPLSAVGRTAATALARKLMPFNPTSLLASPQAKTMATADAMGAVFRLGVRPDIGLVEHRRETTPFMDQPDLEALIQRMFDEPSNLVLGEETADGARDRFAAAITRRPRGEGACVVVCHGTVISLWVARRLNLDPMKLWRSLGMPSAVVLAENGRTFELIE
jgi:broad specificity phosphatase PhoE